MALHKRPTDTYYIEARCGLLKVSSDDETFRAVDGNLVKFGIVADPGNGQVRAKDDLVIILKDRLETYIIQARYPSIFTWQFGAQIATFARGEKMKLRVDGGDNEKITFCKLSKFMQGGWRNADQVEDPHDEGERARVADDQIRNHPAFDKDMTSKRSNP